MFDLHSDILIDLYNKKEETSVLSKHISNLSLGNINKAIWALCLTKEDKRDIDTVINYILKVLEDVKYDYILGLEGLSHVRDLNHLQELYIKGFRHASLTWNEENHFATGCKGDKTRGLTEIGVELVKWMDRNRMIIDLAHANKQTFKEVIRITEKPIMVSHTCCESLCVHLRNVDDMQLKIIKERNGIIGITNVRPFLSPRNRVTIIDFVKHIVYAVNKVGIDKVGIGFDYMDYLGNGTEDMLNLPELYSAKDSSLVIDKLSEYGFNKNEIEKITYRNAENFISKVIDPYLL